MARIRSIKPEFFTSLAVASLPVHARLTFIGLWTHVDDEGRCVDDARLVKAAVWPLDDRTAADVEADLKLLSESSLITRYILSERSYLAVTNWREHQRINRPTPSKYPAPPEGSGPPDGTLRAPSAPPLSRENPPLTEDSLSTHGGLTEGSLAEQGTGNREQGTGNRDRTAPRERGQARGSRLPDDFAVTDKMRDWARENTPTVVVELEAAKFRDHWASKSGAAAVKSDWVAAWRNWMRNAQEWSRPPAGASLALVAAHGRPVAQQQTSVETRRVTAAAEIAARYAAQGE